MAQLILECRKKSRTMNTNLRNEEDTRRRRLNYRSRILYLNAVKYFHYGSLLWLIYCNISTGTWALFNILALDAALHTYCLNAHDTAVCIIERTIQKLLIGQSKVFSKRVATASLLYAFLSGSVTQSHP